MVSHLQEIDMTWLHRNTLKQRLIQITLVAAGIALLLAIAIMFATEMSSFQSTIVMDISIKADIIGNQCTAALLFNVKKDAEETLGALRADAHIEFAAVYTKNGKLFAAFQHKRETGQTYPVPHLVDGYQFSIDHLDLMHPIILHGERIGTIFIRSDLQNLYNLLFKYAAASAIVLVLSLWVAYALVSRLQKTISGPVTGLVSLMDRISQDRDFSMRAKLTGPDELRSLAHGFNEMLGTIQDRDHELERQHLHLEETVEYLRTSTNELQAANEKLQTIDKMKSDFVSAASHELRTPLTTIKAFVELLTMKPDMPVAQKAKLMHTINVETDRLALLIADLLDLARIESGSMKWRIENISIDDIIQNAVSTMRPLFENKNLHVTTALNPPLPPFAGDRDRLLQVVTNILSNAVKFTPREGSIHIAVHEETDPVAQIVVEIIDTGMGIRSEDLELIFEKFHSSGDPRASSIDGTGLGLAIARQIVEYHGGRIWAASTYGKGSTFSFTLPLAGAARIIHEIAPSS